MGRTEPKLAGGHKMKAFHKSGYGDDVVTGLMAQQVCVASTTTTMILQFYRPCYFLALIQRRFAQFGLQLSLCFPVGTVSCSLGQDFGFWKHIRFYLQRSNDRSVAGLLLVLRSYWQLSELRLAPTNRAIAVEKTCQIVVDN